ncbi:hypothetical protein EXIGLDRAFT_775102 [Exidia glandulosa HHB12029]|uniref:Uncharacterized protein n=1 Tax=Exidia glandulosa HHB12029 TaxID=1314781 RepID=A0A165E2A2_EXIGL|nr:hypothetical protein EXIGLDRAFT_775102 [Exidia glandulosa HHB12029]
MRNFQSSILLAAVSLLPLLVPTGAQHLSCNPDPDSSCDAAAYCRWTQNNFDCTVDWHDDGVATFKECIGSDSSGCADGGSCVNGLCCITGNLPNGASDCPTVDQLTACCFEKNDVGVGQPALYQPQDIDRPSELACGC